MANLAAAVKAKYPQYVNIPDDVLEQQVIAKYPQYAPHAMPAPKSVGGFVHNIGTSAVQNVKDIGSGLINVINPDMEKNTIANLIRLIDDAGYAVGGDRSEDNRAIQVGNFYKDRYGGVDNIKDTLYNDPVGVALDLASLLEGGGAILKGAGAVSKLESLDKVGRVATRAGKFVDPLTAPGRVIGRVAPKVSTNVFKTIGGKMSTAADKLLVKGVGNPAKQTEVAAKYGLTMPEYIKKYGVYDRSPETAAAVTADVGKQYSKKATSSTNRLKVQTMLDAFDGEIKKIEEGPQRFSDSGKAMLQELKRRKQQFIDSIGGEAIPDVGVDQVHNFRKGAIDPDIPQSMFGLDPKGSGTAQGAKTSRNIFRDAINSSDKDLERLGMNYGAAKQYQKVLEKSAARADNRQMFNFTKLGGAGIGGLMTGIPGVVGGFLLEQMVNHPKFLEGASKAMEGTGETLKKAKPPKIPNVFKNGVNASVNIGKWNRMINPVQKTPISANIEKAPQMQLKNPLASPIISQPISAPVKVKMPKTVAPKSNVSFGKMKKLKTYTY